ncbi:MAG: hypothetical protein WC004_01385 [Candidatus Absconditabacterales bacterium]
MGPIKQRKTSDEKQDITTNKEKLAGDTATVIHAVKNAIQDLSYLDPKQVFATIEAFIRSTDIDKIRIRNLNCYLEEARKDKRDMQSIIGSMVKDIFSSAEFDRLISAGTLFGIPLQKQEHKTDARPHESKDHYYKGIDAAQFVGEMIGEVLIVEPTSHFSADHNVALMYALHGYNEKPISFILQINKKTIQSQRDIYDKENHFSPNIHGSKDLYLDRQVIPLKAIETIYYFMQP